MKAQIYDTFFLATKFIFSPQLIFYPLFFSIKKADSGKIVFISCILDFKVLHIKLESQCQQSYDGSKLLQGCKTNTKIQPLWFPSMRQQGHNMGVEGGLASKDWTREAAPILPSNGVLHLMQH
jgi:hypothetical protein